MKNTVIKDNLAAPVTSLISSETLGKKDSPVVVWAHGWGQSRKAFLPLAEGLESFGTHTLIDFPGFGDSPMPPEPWGTAEYADEAAQFLRENSNGPVLWVGH